MQSLIPVVLLGWLPVCLFLFTAMPRLQAAVIGVIGAWLFLPPSGISIGGLPDYTKGSAFGYGILLGTLLFQPERLLRFRLHWFDLPMLGYCLCPFASSMSNGLGVYDGLSAAAASTVQWGLPYFAGRLHFGEREGLRMLLVGMTVGAILYVPFCLFEIRMSPVLLPKLYGIGKYQGVRLGGYRPTVFFFSGLELGMWMTVGSLSAIWLRRCGVLTRLWGYPFGTFFLPVLVVTTILCRSSGALVLLASALLILWSSSRFDRRLPMFLLLCSPIFYVFMRVQGVWDYQGLITFIQQNFDANRAQSLEFRFQNEDVLIRKAIQQPLLGWGGWGRSRVFDEYGKDITITDGLWIVEMGTKGLVGVALWLGSFLLPSFEFVRRNRARDWTGPATCLQALVVCIVGISLVDCLLNAMVNSVYTVALGGLVTSLQAGRRFDDLAGPAGSRGDSASAGTAGGAIHPESGSLPDQAPASAALPDVRLADRYLELARSSKAEGSYSTSASAWRHALGLLVHQNELNPGDAYLARRRLDCANNLAWFLVNRPDAQPGDHAEAVELARGAAQADPSNPAYWNTLAAALCRTGDDAGTIAAAERALALGEPDSGTAFDFALMAIAYARSGEMLQAEASLARSRSWCAANPGKRPELDRLLAEATAALQA